MATKPCFLQEDTKYLSGAQGLDRPMPMVLLRRLIFPIYFHFFLFRNQQNIYSTSESYWEVL